MWCFEQTENSFHVREVLLYPLSGKGAHVYARCRKRGLSTQALKRRIAEQTGVPLDRISHAGLKDNLATAEQYLSWPQALERQRPVNGEGYEILELTLHENALSIGHVGANQFHLRLSGSGLAPTAEQLARPFPNFYGRQRFGRDPLPDLDLLLRLARRSRENVSVLQSKLFNAYLRKRWAVGDIGTAEDEIWTHSNGKRCFSAPIDSEIQRRFSAGEILPTGPIFGYKVKARADEVAFLAELELNPELFRRFGKVALGARRPLLVHPEIHSVQQEEGSLTMLLSLPSGAYATGFLLSAFRPEVWALPESEWPNFTQPVVLAEDAV